MAGLRIYKTCRFAVPCFFGCARVDVGIFVIRRWPGSPSPLLSFVPRSLYPEALKALHGQFSGLASLLGSFL